MGIIPVYSGDIARQRRINPSIGMCEIDATDAICILRETVKSTAARKHRHNDCRLPVLTAVVNQ